MLTIPPVPDALASLARLAAICERHEDNLSRAIMRGDSAETLERLERRANYWHARVMERQA